MTHWQELRKNYPLVENFTYLNTPVLGPISKKTYEKSQRYLEDAMNFGSLHYLDWETEVNEVREDVGKLINAQGKDIAFVGDVATGMNFLADMLPIDGGEVMVFEKEFPSVALPWYNQHYKIKKIPADCNGVIDIALLETLATPETKVLALSYVQYNSGFKTDLNAIGSFCRDHNILFVVDATQAIGAFEIDVQKYKIDVLLASTYKWALSGYGTAIFYMNPQLLGERFPAVGWHSLSLNNGIPELKNVKRSIQSLEIGHPKFNNILMLGSAIKEISELNVSNIEKRIISLTKKLHLLLKEKGVKIINEYDDKNLSGITIIEGNEELVQELKKKDILCSFRGDGLRVGLHFYNNEDDIKHFVREL